MSGRDAQSAIVIDGVFFQLNNTGIARVWSEILKRWQDADIGRRIVLLDRKNSLPKFPKLRTLSCPEFRYEGWREDRAVVQKICDSVGAGLFVSTYFTRAERTPGVVLVHDMIPERFNYNLQTPTWQQKHDAIRHAVALAAVSRNTLADLNHFIPETAAKPVLVASPGVGAQFVPPRAEEQKLFRASIVIPYLGGRPYFLFACELSPEKNAPVLLRALQRMPEAERSRIGLLFTHKGGMLNDFSSLPGLKVHAARFTDTGLRSAYGSALALVYPSQYEGFGLPPLEAMACGCPVICSNTSSIPEVVGDAALLIDTHDDAQLLVNLNRVQDSALRERLRVSGMARAKTFSWDEMAVKLTSLDLIPV
jgi:glycosyltransferase involved in cell wall biosynthesis